MSEAAGIDHLRRLRTENELVVIDGGMGTELEAQGAEMDHFAWSGLANLKDPGLVQRVHEAYVVAGADVLITNTFMSGVGPLSRAGEEDRFQQANRNAVKAAHHAAATATDRRIVVAGSISVTELAAVDTGDAVGALRHRRLRDGYRRQAEILADEEVDLIALEMADHPLYAEPAVEAVAETGLPLWLGLCVVGEHGDTPDGPAVVTDEHREVLQLARDDAFDAVCVMHTDVDHVDEVLAGVNENRTRPLGVYPHHGFWTRPNWQFADISVERFVTLAREWRAQGATMIGGCCGIRPRHIAALRSAAQSW